MAYTAGDLAPGERVADDPQQAVVQ
jgi:hypothetical protein